MATPNSNSNGETWYYGKCWNEMIKIWTAAVMIKLPMPHDCKTHHSSPQPIN